MPPKQMKLANLKERLSGDSESSESDQDISHHFDASNPQVGGTEVKGENQVKELLQIVERDMEVKEGLIAQVQGISRQGIMSLAEKMLGWFILMAAVPGLFGFLFFMLYQIFSSKGYSVRDTYFDTFGLVLLMSLSCIGCLYIIMSHFLYVNMWSERRQLLMFSSWPGLIHCMCCLYEFRRSVEDDYKCDQTLTMLNQVCFLMQMSWQVAMVHGVFRYLLYDKPVMKGYASLMRHILCWGIPTTLVGIVGLMFPGAYMKERHLRFDSGADTNAGLGSGAGAGSGDEYLSPFCGVSDLPQHRALKAIFVHFPHIFGVLLYAFFYFYIAASVDPSQKHGSSNSNTAVPVRTFDETAMSTSMHRSLLHSSQEKRLLDISRAVVTIRICMAAFVSAYLLETICAIIVENFGTTDWVPLELLYGFRVVFIAPQQLVYAWVFSSKRTGRIVEHFLEFHTATIMSSGGRAMVRVNTTFNRLMLETILHNSGKTVASGIEGGKTVASGLEGGITSGLQVGKKSASSVSNILINDVNIFVLSHAVGISSMIGKTIGTVVQAVLFTPVAFFVWVPVNFLQNNYFTELINSKIFASVALYSVLVISPFVYFQGTPNATVSTWVVRGHVLIVETLCAIGISKNRSDPQLLIVDGPKDHVRTNFRNLLAYGTVLVELWQIPLLAVTASHLTTRYSGGDFSGPQAQRSLAVGDYVLHFVFDDLFLLQYPMALLGVFLWMLIFCCSEAVAIVYRKAFDSLINKFQLVLYGLSGPGYIFIVKNLMRPLFCVHRDGYSDTPYRVAAHKQFPCWGPVHLNLCAVSLFCLCVFLPSATLTNAIRFSAPEDIRYVYYFLRFEVYVKGSMVFLSLATQFASDPETMSYKVEQYISLMILILGSISLMLVVRLMQPCCQKHIHRLKYFLHCCSIWVCLTCMVVVLTDNKSWQLHVAWVLVGWFLCGIGFVAFEVQHQKQDIFGQESTERVIDVCLNDIEHLQTVIATKFRTWETHSFILRLLKFCQHDNSEIAKKGHETLAVLSYLDQMTQQDTFFAFAPNTCVQMLCATISQHEDERVRSFAVRTLKTFLQEDRYVREISVYTDTPESSVGEPLAAIMRESRQLVTKIDAAICLLALCSVDSNQLAAVVDLLPILTDWVSNGSIVMQHLALELITSLSTRFDLCLPIISEGCLEAMFELCLAIDATSNGRYKDGLEQNTSNGFRKGFKQPDRCENLAHQLPRNVLQDFCTHFETVEDMINNLSSNELDTSGKPSKLISLDQSQGMHRLRSLDHALSTDSVQYSSDDMRDSASSSHSPEPQHRNPLSAGSTVTRRKKAKRAITRVIDTKPKTPQMSINVDDFIAWIQSGSFLSEQIKEKWISQMNGAKGSSIVELTENSLKELFDAIDDDKSGDLDEVEIATFLEDLGLGSRDDLQRLLLDTGVRQRGLGEISSAGTSTLEIDKGDFRHWIRNGVRKDGLARAMVKQCLGETINESTLDDNMIDQLFAEIDEDGGGTLDSDELATFLEAEGLGGQAELEQMLKEEIVGKSVVDTVVQMSAKQIRVIKSEMNSFILHIIMELATGMSGMGRRQLIKSGAVDVILLGLRGDNQKGTRLVALQALHALMSDKFALEDVMADKEFEGYYADLLQLSGQAHASNHELDLVFTDLSPKQRRKVHMVAQFTGMKHRSSGPPDKRLVTVTSAPDNNAVQTLNGGKLNSIAGSWDKKMSKSLDLEDPFDYQFYNNNRDMVATNELLGVLTVMAADMAADDQITFHAWDVIVLCVKYDAISPDKTEQIWRICIQVVLQHPTVAVAVLASWALDYIISRKTHLFEQKKGIAKFQSAGRRIMMGIRVARAWRSVNAGGEIDEGVQKTRTTLR